MIQKANNMINRLRGAHPVAVIATCTVAAVLMLAAGARVAAANSYDVYACYAGQGTYLNPGDSAISWSLANNNGTAYYLPFDQCGATDNGFGVISRSGYTAPAADYGEVYFEAPNGLRISRVQLWRSLYDYGLGSGGTSQRNYAMNFAEGNLPGVGDEFEGSEDVSHGAAGSGDTTENGIMSSNHISIDLAASLPHTYAYEIGCGFVSGCTTGGHDPDSPSGPDTVLKIYGAIVSVEDDTPPTLSLANTGLLDGSTQSGTVPLTINAADAAGIAKVEVYADSSPNPSSTEDFTQTSRCAFYEAIPCQNLSNYEYAVDTTKLPDGTYYITVKVYDPAGNMVAVSSSSPVTVENAPDTALSSALTGGPRAHVANGDPCAGVELGLEVNGQRGVPVIPYGRAVTVRGVLHCGTVAIRDAQVDIATVGGAASEAVDGTVQTGLDGSFSYAVPAGPDRSLQFSYTAFSDDPGPSATAIATTAIRPRIKLRIAPHHTSNGHSIRWAGTIAGGPYPSQGVTLDVEVQEGRRWRIFDQVVANRRGQFHYGYRFHATVEATTYRFRVALPASGSGGYPYTPGASNTVDVRVNP